MRWSRSTLRVVAINLALLTAGISALELGFGRWFSGIGFSAARIGRNEHQIYDVSDFYAAGRTVEYRRDANGLRGRYRDVTEVRLLAI